MAGFARQIASRGARELGKFLSRQCDDPPRGLKLLGNALARGRERRALALIQAREVTRLRGRTQPLCTIGQSTFDARQALSEQLIGAAMRDLGEAATR